MSLKNIYHFNKNRIFDSLYNNFDCISVGNYSILPNLNEESVVYSFGVGHGYDFEKELTKKFNTNILLFDPSPTGIKTMEGNDNKNIRFFPIGVAGKSGKVYFDYPDNPKEGSFKISTNKETSFECKTLKDLMKENNHKKIDLLKMDIEGFEYEVIDNIINNSLDVNQIVLEFHGWMKELSRKRDKEYINKLKVNGYFLVHKSQDDYTFIKYY